MAKKDYRVKVTVVFTIDVGVEEGFLAGADTAELITKQVFAESFSRAHLLELDCIELMEFKRDGSK